MARGGRSIKAVELEKWIAEFDFDNDKKLSFKEFINMM
jgi:Ca2+-binding EF-hand superfamily protein